MKKQQLPIRIMMLVAALLCWSHAAYAENPKTVPTVEAKADAKLAPAEEAKPTLSIPDNTMACLNGCVDQMKKATEHACVTADAYKQCLKTSYGCVGIEWDQKSVDAITNSCQTWGERMCGCGTAVKAPANGGAKKPAAGPKPAQEGVVEHGTPKVEPLTPKEDCEQIRHGIWIQVPGVPEVRYEGGKKITTPTYTYLCYTLKHAYDEIQDLKKRLAEGGNKFTDEEIERLRRVVSIEQTKGIPSVYNWGGDLNEIARGLEVICRLPADEEAKLRADVEASGGKYSITIACEATRKKIDQAITDSKDAVKLAGDANQTAGEAKADAAKALDTAEKAGSTSPLIISLDAGGLFWRMPGSRNPRFGRETLLFGGVEGIWLPRIAGITHLDARLLAGYSTKFYGSNSGVMGFGIGLGFDLAPDIIGGVGALALHFSTDRELMKANFYGGGLNFRWLPGYKNRPKSGIVPAVTADLMAGDSRVDLLGPTDEFNMLAEIGIGIGF